MSRATLGVPVDPARHCRCGERPPPTRVLLKDLQARFAQRLYARREDGRGPEEILIRERSTLTERLRAAAAHRRGETVAAQRRGGSSATSPAGS